MYVPSLNAHIPRLDSSCAVYVAYFCEKVVSCTPSEAEIPPHGKAEMKVEYVPRKVNSKYRKTLTVVNCRNPHGNVNVEIAASNTDTHHVLYHSHFYKVQCTSARYSTLLQGIVHSRLPLTQGPARIQ